MLITCLKRAYSRERTKPTTAPSHTHPHTSTATATLIVIDSAFLLAPLDLTHTHIQYYANFVVDSPYSSNWLCQIDSYKTITRYFTYN